MTRIFISYRRDDSAGYVGRLFDRLANQFGREAIFTDIDTIPPGEDFVEAINDAISACDIVLVVMGKQWADIEDNAGQRRLDNPNDFVRLEIATALKMNKRVIPCLVRGASMPYPNQLPSDLQPLLRRNAKEISDHNFHHDMDELIRALHRNATPVPQRPVSTPTRNQVRQPSHTTPRPSPQRNTKSILHSLLWQYVIVSVVLYGVMAGIFGTFLQDVLDQTFPHIQDEHISEALFISGIGFLVGMVVHGVVVSMMLKPLTNEGLSLSSLIFGGPLSILLFRRIVPTIHQGQILTSIFAWGVGLIVGAWVFISTTDIPEVYLIDAPTMTVMIATITVFIGTGWTTLLVRGAIRHQ